MKLSFNAEPKVHPKRAEFIAHQQYMRERKMMLRQLTLKVCSDFNMPEQRVFWQEMQNGGYALLGKAKIKMAYWLMDKCDEYQCAVMLHELAHQLQWHETGKSDHHDRTFMQYETKLLRKYLKIIPLYQRKRGYCVAFMTAETHRVVCDGYGNTPYSDEFVLTI